MNIINVISGVFKIKNEGTTDFQKVLDAHAECCAGVDCCRQVLILRDQSTDVQYVGYFLNGVWTTKTLQDFDQNGA